MENNQLKTTKIEFHIIQSFPVSCLNRDDVGSPKTAQVGGVNRARVSSQCWKRVVRKQMQEFGVQTGLRTKNLDLKIAQACTKFGKTEEEVLELSKKIAGFFTDDTLIFMSKSEIEGLAEYANSIDFDLAKAKDKDAFKAIKATFEKNVDGLDVLLFGRMVAKATSMNIDGASSFAHALSTHKVVNESDFFTALDDEPQKDGSAHMDTAEFNSATYYRYISLDLGQLTNWMSADSIKKAVEVFTKALYLAVPSARQTTMTGLSSWDYAKVLVRQGQACQVSFENPIKSKGEGFSKPSIEVLNTELIKKEKMFGSLFGKVGEFEIGGESDASIDDLTAFLGTTVEKISATN